ncbi:MAG: glycosyltransferase family 4 protein [Candidatus Marinimicrobia bacterium]|nr:glycosyltransferase family 4 protein [Candidatus Neomarinimicrobiota bacterium]
MRIVIDARMYGLEHAGIGRYVLNLVKELEKQDKKNDYYLLLRKKYFQELNFKNKRFKKVLADIPHYSIKEQFFLPGIISKIKPDLVHFPHFNVPLFYRGKYIVTIHDLIKHQSKGKETTTRLPFLYWPKYVLYRLIIFLAIKRARRIITPSQYWQKELSRRYSVKPEKITVTYEGADEFLKQKTKRDSQIVLREYNITKPFVIYTGNLYPHKNVLRLVKAIAQINQKNKKPLALVIACSRDIFLERFEKEIEKVKGDIQVTLAGFVPTEELTALYQEAEAFVTPSFLEGFGLPGLEAMASGTPVLSSNASCLPEIYGEAALYFDPLKTKEMVKRIEEVVGHPRKRQALIKKGKEQVKKYSWEKMAREMLKVYEG